MSKEWIDLIGGWIEEGLEEEIGNVPLTQVMSSNLAAVGYDSNRYELIIAFLDGSVYRYYGVPQEEFNGLLRADSHGEYFVDNIRLVYPYERILG